MYELLEVELLEWMRYCIASTKHVLIRVTT